MAEYQGVSSKNARRGAGLVKYITLLNPVIRPLLGLQPSSRLAMVNCSRRSISRNNFTYSTEVASGARSQKTSIPGAHYCSPGEHPSKQQPIGTAEVQTQVLAVPRLLISQSKSHVWCPQTKCSHAEPLPVFNTGPLESSSAKVDCRRENQLRHNNAHTCVNKPDFITNQRSQHICMVKAITYTRSSPEHGGLVSALNF